MNWLEQRSIDFHWNSRESRLLNDSLDRWIEITSRDQFDKVSIIMKENNLFDLTTELYDSISKNWENFVIKKSNNRLDIYWKNDNFISRNFRRYSNPFRLIWFIESWKQFQKLLWDEVYIQDENNLAENLISQINQIRSETISRLKDLKEQVIVDEDYKIQKGDTLWKIVKERYWLDNNRDIANTINALVRYNKNIKKTDVTPPDGIRWDIIIEGKTIKIPHKLKVMWKNYERKEKTSN